MTEALDHETTSTLPPGFSTSIGTIDRLLERAEQTPVTTDLIVAPVDLHARNLKMRLADANLPLDAFAFTDPDALASDILAVTGPRPSTLDRVDRLSLLEEILAEDNEASDRFRLQLGGPPASSAKEVEQARAEVEAVTNLHPDRLAAFRELAASVSGPVAADLTDVLTGTLAVQRELRNRTARSPSDAAVLRAATRQLANEGAEMTEAYPSIERIVVVGLSSIPAPLLDLLTAITRHCDLDVELYLRPATGPLLTARLPAMLSIDTPGQVVL